MTNAKILALCLFLATWSTSCARTADHYIAKGKELMAENKYAEAELNFRKALHQRADAKGAHYELAQAELKQNKIANAYKSLSTAAELDPEKEKILIEFASLSYEIYTRDARPSRNFFHAAMKTSERLLLKNPKHIQALQLRGALALTDRRPAEALQFFRRGYAIEPGKVELALGIVEAEMQSGNRQAAQDWAERYLQERPQAADMYDMLYRIQLSLNRIEAAERTLRAKAKALPNEIGPVIQLAEFFDRSGRNEEMTSTLKSLMERSTKLPDAYLAIGDFHARGRRWPEAVNVFEIGLALDSKQRSVYQKRLVSALMAQERLPEAEAMVAKVLQSDPNDLSSKLQRATIWARTGEPKKLDAAIQELQSAAVSAPTDHTLRYVTGLAFLRKGDIPAARKEMIEARRMSGGYLLPRITLAELSHSDKQTQETIRYAGEVIALQPKHPGARLLMAKGLGGAGRLLEAKGELSRLLNDFPNFREARLQLGLVLVYLKRFQEAEAIFSELRKNVPTDTRATEGLVLSLSTRSEFDRAIQLLRSGGEPSSNHPAIRRLLISIAVRAGQFDIAEQEGKAAVSAAPDSLAARVILADVTTLKGDYIAAVQQLEVANRIKPGDPRILAMLGSAYQSSRQPQLAMNIYRQALKFDPANTPVKNNLAYLIAETGGDLNEALQLAQSALTTAKDQALYQDTVGFIHLKRGALDSALPIFRSLAAKFPDNPTYLTHLGQALLATGARQEARLPLESALAKNPSAAEAGEIKRLLGIQ